MQVLWDMQSATVADVVSRTQVELQHRADDAADPRDERLRRA